MKRIVVYGLGSLGMSIAKELKKREERRKKTVPYCRIYGQAGI